MNHPSTQITMHLSIFVGFFAVALLLAFVARHSELPNIFPL